MFGLKIKIAKKFSLYEQIVLFHGNCLDLLKDIPDKSIRHPRQVNAIGCHITSLQYWQGI